jgi:hypothetical protein
LTVEAKATVGTVLTRRGCIDLLVQIQHHLPQEDSACGDYRWRELVGNPLVPVGQEVWEERAV